MFLGAHPTLMQSEEVAATPAPTQATSWNPDDKGAPTVLSNNNMTATGTTSNNVDSITRATKSRSTGKFSLRIAHNGNIGCGIANAAASKANGEYPGKTTDSIGCFVIGGTYYVYRNGAQVNGATPSGAGSIDMAVDLDARKVWFIANGTQLYNGGNPTNGTGGYALPAGALFPCCDTYNNTVVATIDTQNSRFTGYPAWDAT